MNLPSGEENGIATLQQVPTCFGEGRAGERVEWAGVLLRIRVECPAINVGVGVEDRMRHKLVELFLPDAAVHGVELDG